MSSGVRFHLEGREDRGAVALDVGVRERQDQG